MPRYTTSQTYTEGNTQIVALPDVEEKKVEVVSGEVEDEPYEVKLQRISESVPLKIVTVMGSTAGSGSGDFHQYRNMRRHEQDRLMRMEADYRKRTEAKLFEQRRAERLKEDEERTAKKRAKRQKKKEKMKKKARHDAPGSNTPSTHPAVGADGGDNEEEGSEGEEEQVEQGGLD